MVKMDARVSVIIPFAKSCQITPKCIEACFRQDYPCFEIILLPDKPLNQKFKKMLKSLSSKYPINYKIIPTGHVFPSEKRNIGVDKSNCSIVAFIDDDAIPLPDWLETGTQMFQNKAIGGVGGPASPPENASASELAADFIIKSGLGIGSAYNFKKMRIKINGKKCNILTCDDLASCNLLVRKDVLLEVGKFDASLETAEDIELCKKIRKTGKLLVFIPKMGVIHRMRPLFLDQMKRIYVLSKTRPKLMFSDMALSKLIFIIPTIFTLGVFFGFILSFFNLFFLVLYAISLSAYFLFVIMHLIKAKAKHSIIPWVIIGAPLIHISYGWGFIMGLVKGVKK